MDDAPKHPVPVFPLPDVVLFPHARLPLHIFELRYRTMVRDALSGERMIAMALLKPGWERDYAGSPAFHPFGCVGRIERVEWLPNDCYNLMLLGVARVRFGALVREQPLSDDDPLVQVEKHALREAFQAWVLQRPGAELPPPPPPGTLGLEALTNLLCASVPADGPRKQTWLELDSVIERAHRVREWLERRIREGREPSGPGGEQN
jgi:Lon protease-like protein